jgi:heptosyltransferase-3
MSQTPLTTKNLTFLISRVDAIGDVILTLPMARLLKKTFPSSKIIFLGQTYTKPVVGLLDDVDVFLDWSQLKKEPFLKKMKVLRSYKIDYFIHVFPHKELALLSFLSFIPYRVGTLRRWFHLLFLNVFHNLKRKTSLKHEALLNLELLIPVFQKNKVDTKILHTLSLEELASFNHFTPQTRKGFETEREKEILALIDPNKINVIFHPYSKGSAREWPSSYFIELSHLIKEGLETPLEDLKEESLEDGKEGSLEGQEKAPKKEASVQIFITGSKEDSFKIQSQIIPFVKEHVKDVSGLFSLEEFIYFISQCHMLLAASTGPLHIAASLGIKAFGLYPAKRSIHPLRWSPLGLQAQTLCVFSNEKLTNQEFCEKECGKDVPCACMAELTPFKVYETLKPHLRSYEQLGHKRT